MPVLKASGQSGRRAGRGAVGEDVADLPGGLGRHQAQRRVGDASRHHRQPPRLPAPRDRRVQLHQPLQAHAHAAQRHRQPGRVAGDDGLDAGLAHRREQPRRPERLGERHDRQVQRGLQRVAGGDRAAEDAVEVLRGVAAVVLGAVVQERLGVGEAVGEGEAVDERLQGRAGRAQRLGHVDEAAARVAGVVGRADAGEDRARVGVGDQQRERGGRGQVDERAARRAPRARPAGRRRAWCGAPGRRGRRRAADRPRGGRGRGRGVARSAALRASRRRRPRAVITPASTARSSTRSRASRAASGCSSGRAAGGRLRQRDQQRGLGLGEALGLLAEPGEAAGAHPLEVAAHGGELQVERQDLLLGAHPLERQRHAHLAELAAPRAGGAVLEQARDLHRQGRAAGDPAAVADRQEAGARERPRVDAAVPVEAVVLVGEQHRQVAGVDPRGVDRQPPAAVRRR